MLFHCLVINEYLPGQRTGRLQIYLRAVMAGSPDWTNDSSEKKRSGFERVSRADTNGNFIFPVAMRLRVTPVPIPNTMVKT